MFLDGNEVVPRRPLFHLRPVGGRLHPRRGLWSHELPRERSGRYRQAAPKPGMP